MVRLTKRDKILKEIIFEKEKLNKIRKEYGKLSKISFKLTVKERLSIIKNAQKDKMSISQYIRSKVLGAK
jgi:hypothetical protein